MIRIESRSIEEVDSNGIKRRVSLGRSEGGTIQIMWETWWDGTDSEPLITSVRLSTPALNAMLLLISEFNAFPGRFPEPVIEED